MIFSLTEIETEIIDLQLTETEIKTEIIFKTETETEINTTFETEIHIISYSANCGYINTWISVLSICIETIPSRSELEPEN